MLGFCCSCCKIETVTNFALGDLEVTEEDEACGLDWTLATLSEVAKEDLVSGEAHSGWLDGHL